MSAARPIRLPLTDCLPNSMSGRKPKAPDASIGGPVQQHTGRFGPAQPEPTDVSLVAAARGGDPSAQEQLFARHAPDINNLVHRLLGSDSELSDVVQQSFIAALISLQRLEDPAAFGPWLRSIAITQVRRLIRRRQLRRRLGLESYADLPEGIAGHWATPEMSVELKLLYRLLDQLPADARIVFVLHRFEEMTFVEIAQQLNVSTRTARRRWQKAERRLSSIRELSHG